MACIYRIANILVRKSHLRTSAFPLSLKDDLAANMRDARVHSFGESYEKLLDIYTHQHLSERVWKWETGAISYSLKLNLSILKNCEGDAM